MTPRAPIPLDLERTPYAYVERPNAALVGLVRRHVLSVAPEPRLLDVGCGCGANARAILGRAPRCHITGIEPNPRAAALAARTCAEVFPGTLQAWLGSSAAESATYDAVILSDVLEHMGEPVRSLTELASTPAVARATWIISVPNYAVWYNRLRTLLGRFEYAWSGLYDRTHLRFYTRQSLRRLLEYCGLGVLEDACTPSLVQSAAPVLRKFFAGSLGRGEHLALAESGPFRVYEQMIEPLETALCAAWPELLGFQIVVVARRTG